MSIYFVGRANDSLKENILLIGNYFITRIIMSFTYYIDTMLHT